MNRFSILSLAAVLALSAPPAIAQQAAAPTAISRVTLFRIPAGQRPAFDKDMKENVFPIWEAEKKAGIIVSYSVYGATPRTPQDADIILTITYKNMAALDGLEERTDAIDKQIFGSLDDANKGAISREQMRSVIGSDLIRELISK